MIRAAVALLLLFIAAVPAQAHTRSQSMSHWRVEGDTLVARVEADALDVTRLYALGSDRTLEETFRLHATQSFEVATSLGPCAQDGEPVFSAATPGRIAVALRFVCPPSALAKGVELRTSLFLDVAASHLHFATVSGPAGAEAEAVLTDSRRAAQFNLRPATVSQSATASFWRYVPVGAAHVWGGLDHVAFILALVLLARGFVPILIAASGFTLGHTATLVLAALGVLKPDPATVEALIGFTVAFVALEAARGGENRLARWAWVLALALTAMAALAALNVIGLASLSLVGVALFVIAYPRGLPRGVASAPWLAGAFGLIHGCGFAGALGELDLPRPKLLSALAGFNVGVELAQAAVIAGALVVAAVWRRLPLQRMTWAPDAICAALVALGTYWFFSRALAA
jgi:hypothetical protein